MKYLIYILTVISFIGCGTNSNTNSDNISSTIPITENTTTPTRIIDINNTILNKLNDIRVNSGMIALTNNSYLNSSAYNHAYYLNINSLVDHNESSSKQGFTGLIPVDRAIYSGFKSRMISENLSVGQETEEFSLKGLMSAIYHRFGFLDFNINTIGYGKENVSYVYNMGNSDLNNLCEGRSFEEIGSYYINTCADSTFKIEANIYSSELNKTINANPSYVIYPYNNEKNVTTSFYEETPDPLPTYDVSGYPISIEFNKNKYDMNKLSINSFIIYDDSNNVLELAQDYNNSSNILSKVNDRNNHISDYQFAIFSKNRLNFDTHYNVEFSYTYDGESKNITWGFKTEKLDNFIQYSNTNLSLSVDTKYNIYIPPINENDIYNRFSISCSYSSTASSPIYDIDFYDKNTITLKISGENINNCSLVLNPRQSNENNISINIR